MEENTAAKQTANARLMTILEETLLVEIMDKSVGVDGFGKRSRMVMSREMFNQQKKDIEMRVVEILKPAGVTFEQHRAAGKDKKKEGTAPPAPKPPKAAKIKDPKPAAANPFTDFPPEKDEVSEGDEIETIDAMKKKMEDEAMSKLLKEHGGEIE